MKRKTLNELTLLDKFLFDETMDDPEVHEAALQIIFRQENLKLLETAHTENSHSVPGVCVYRRYIPVSAT